MDPNFAPGIVGTQIPTTVKDTYASRDGSMKFDKRARPGDTPELICRRCKQDVCSVAYKRTKKWLDAADAHVLKKCVEPQVSLESRQDAPALGAPELRGLVFVARGCLDKGVCDNAVLEAKQFSESGWSLIDPRLDDEGKSLDNRRQRPIRAYDGNRKTVSLRTVGQLVTDELSQSLKGGHTRSEQYLVLQFGTGYQDSH